ncbi:sodium:calcium antiporter [Actinoallomurus bryophytorum]|uniref:Cation:H+ antiporter n=1 Tax=Actinoallomurus bryophytorum TaxID=1490222 RepID=A0A543CVN3_9ACTN|nr:sodium:calcium antiporter [Actinoallomurus bryophytorum]TQM01162.1 cation:H+ antiporter [Actinoallomurus bryophytorum]
MLHVVILLACAVAIYLSCEWFVNAVEWLGLRLKVGPLAVGTVLAAFGTALPESVVTFVAVVLGSGPDQKDIGVGAAMGGPLALATAAYGVTGFMLLTRRRKVAVPAEGGEPPRERRDNLGDTRKLARDQRWFLVIFVVKVGLGLVTFAFKPWLGLLFFAAYGVYFWRELRAESSDDEVAEIEPLRLQPRRATPATWAVVVQAVATLAVIFVASQLFVHQLEAVGPMLGLPAAVTALLLAPIATELPEIMNAIIWVRQGKTHLALANISGAMMIQATVPSGLGILFTRWRFDGPLLLSGIVTIVAMVFLLFALTSGRFSGRTLTWAAAFYGLFAVCLIPILV